MRDRLLHDCLCDLLLRWRRSYGNRLKLILRFLGFRKPEIAIAVDHYSERDNEQRQSDEHRHALPGLTVRRRRVRRSRNGQEIVIGSGVQRLTVKHGVEDAQPGPLLGRNLRLSMPLKRAKGQRFWAVCHGPFVLSWRVTLWGVLNPMGGYVVENGRTDGAKNCQTPADKVEAGT